MMPTMVAAHAVLRPRDVPHPAPRLAVTAVAVIPAFVPLGVERRPRTIAEHRCIRALEAEAEVAA